MNVNIIQELMHSKIRLVDRLEIPCTVKKGAQEGGCGVVGFCCLELVGRTDLLTHLDFEGK